MIDLRRKIRKMTFEQSVIDLNVLRLIILERQLNKVRLLIRVPGMSILKIILLRKAVTIDIQLIIINPNKSRYIGDFVAGIIIDDSVKYTMNYYYSFINLPKIYEETTI